MKKRDLIPPLEVIESDLFAAVESLRPTVVQTICPENTDPVEETVTPEMPDFIKDAIHRRVSVREVASPQPFAPGQIRRIASHLTANGEVKRHLARPVALLLDQPTGEGDVWSGWLVAPETDYATVWDVLLEADADVPFDPLAGMIQVWNPLNCVLAPDALLLASLSPERLAAVRAVAEAFPYLSGDESPKSGFVSPRTVSGYSMLMGSVLGDTTDPRRVYQNLYFQLAQELRWMPQQRQAQPGEDKPQRNVLPIKARTFASQRPAWLAIAASVLVVQSGVIAYLLQAESGMQGESAQFRSVGSFKQRNAQIEVAFKAEALEVDIRRLLVNVGGEIVAGPSRNGTYQIHLHDDNLGEAIRQIKQSPIVESTKQISGSTAR